MIIPNQQLTAEDLMMEAYRRLHGIDIKDCDKVEGDLSKLEITLEGKKKPFTNFLRRNAQVVAMDNYSTKEMNDQLIRQMGMPADVAKLYSPLYLEAFRNWGVIRHNEINVGILDNALVYNGYPKVADPENYLRDPHGEHDRVLGIMLSSPNPSDYLGIHPVFHKRLKVYLRRDFLKSNPIISSG